MFILRNNDKIILQTIIFMVVLYAWISFLSSLFGIFYPIFIWIIWLIICTILFKKNILAFTKPTKYFSIYILIAFSFSLFIAFFTVPTIFSGRDQGSLAEASMRLAQQHSLIQHTPESDIFFNIYGHGKALNFPGFFYTADGGLITQFPLPYIAYLGGFYGIFNIMGLIIANFILLFTFIIAITSIAMQFVNQRYTFAFLTILLSSFSIGWFAKFTLSENFTAMLFWSALTLYFSLKKSTTNTNFILFIFTISLLLFSRIEGIWFFFIFLFLLLHNRTTQIFIKKDLWWYAFFPSTILFTIICAVAIMNSPFILTMTKVLIGTSQNVTHSISFLNKISYLFSIYAIYGLLLPLIIAGTASLVAISNKRYRKIILPLIIVFPLTIYYIFPHISSDHPWMLRRFVFALLPATILTSVIFISYIRSTTIVHKTIKYTLIIILFITNIPAFIFFITYAENVNLYTQTSQIAKNFKNNDLILVDKNAMGNGWSMITNPLRLNHKRAVYFFNPHDFDKINTDAFEHVFLITSNQNEKIYTDILHNKMRYITKYIIHTNQLPSSEIKTFLPIFPQKQKITVEGTIYELKK